MNLHAKDLSDGTRVILLHCPGESLGGLIVEYWAIHKRAHVVVGSSACDTQADAMKAIREWEQSAENASIASRV